MMMFNLYVQQNQWIVATLLGGGALMILFCLVYWAMWRPREMESKMAGRISIEGPGTFFRWILSFMPWALILIIISSVIFSVTHLRAAAAHLPNW